MPILLAAAPSNADAVILNLCRRCALRRSSLALSLNHLLCQEKKIEEQKSIRAEQKRIKDE
jgi:hypothetical protein